MMRTRLVILTGAALLAASMPAFAQKSAILGSAHDLRLNQTTGNACQACHTPHNANPDAQALLWVRAIRPATYTVYDTSVNPDFAGGAVDLNVGGKISLLCLSCHDGTVALNVPWSGPANPTFDSGAITGNAALGVDLRNDHPIGFDYDSSQTAKPADFNATPPAAIVFYNTPQRRMECGTCHNVHNPTFAPFLRMSNSNSALCLGCHV